MQEHDSSIRKRNACSATGTSALARTLISMSHSAAGTRITRSSSQPRRRWSRPSNRSCGGFLLTANRRAWRALEIGCGPGRLMRPLSRHFGEIHGVDVSDEMIARARANLRGIPHAHPHHTSGADLAPFADESFDFVYSYAVFQHIPSRDVVMQYLREARRVLKPGGILRAQINGLDQTAARYDTWSGVRIPAEEVAAFARENDMQLLALEGARTQYMWTTMRKRAPGWLVAAGAAGCARESAASPTRTTRSPSLQRPGGSLR